MSNSTKKLQLGSKGPGTQKKLKLSLNERIFNKDPQSPTDYAEGFMAVESTVEELAETVRSGIAFSFQYKNNYRKKDYFICTDILALDFDGGVTIEEILGHPLVKEHASLLYTTVSHTADDHHFRIVFVLPRTIECANELKWATKALATRLGSDPNATDAARWFAGSHGCTPILLGGSISPVLLDELVEDGRQPIRFHQQLSVPATLARSGRPIQNGESVKLESGEILPFEQIKVEGKQGVYCPFHVDHSPSAFISKTSRGKFLSCSSCGQTWWAEDAGPSEHDFSDFDKAIRDLTSPRVKLPEELVGLEEFMGPLEVSPKNIWIQNNRYLQVPQFIHQGVKEGLFFIKSPKGTGKTYFLSELLNKRSLTHATSSVVGSDDPKIIPFKAGPSDPKVLVIGHRKALIGELCKRLGLRSYLDGTKSKGFYADQKSMRRFGVCVDSLGKVKGQKYDVVVIDEVEQVLKHFLGNTVGNKRQRLFECFAGLISSAKQVIALDADLGWLSFVTLNTLKNTTFLEPRKVEGNAWSVHILLNDYPVSDRRLDSFENQNHLIADMQQAALDGKRLFVTSNSRRLIDKLRHGLADFAIETDADTSMKVVTSENSTDNETQEFIKNIKDRILDYKVVLCSPSLGTGIDITFPDDEQNIDCVYGFFENGVTNHFDIDQQLCRVRHPKEVKVWVSPRCFRFETAFKIVQSDVLNSDLFGAADYGTPLHKASDQQLPITFLTMATLAAIKDRASLNRLKRNFLAAKRETGWNVVEIEKSECRADAGKEFLKKGNQLAQEEYNDRIMSATTLKQGDYERLRQRVRYEDGELTRDERSNYWRTSLELFYHDTISLALLEFDKQGRSRRRVRLYEALKQFANGVDTTDGIVLPYDRKLLKQTHLSVLPDLQARTNLLHALLQTTPIYQNGRFIPGVEYCANDLAKLVKTAIRLKPYIEGQLGISVRHDIEQKPVQFIGTLLSKVGVARYQTRQEKVETGRVRYYMIDKNSIEWNDLIYSRRSEIDGWKYLNEQYGFEDTLEDIEYLSTYAA